MNESNAICCFVLLALALGPVAHGAADEKGRGELIAKLRGSLGQSAFGRLVDCFCCLSQWVSLPLAIWLSSGWAGLILHWGGHWLGHWHALSGIACLHEGTNWKSWRFFPVRLAGKDNSEGDLSCAVVSNEGR